MQELATSSLYKDILEFQEVKNSTVIHRLLKALALQVGSEVSLHEIGTMIGIDLRTVERYINLLEKSYVVYRLPPYYTNKRKEISKKQKVFFYDNGIRNALVNNLKPLELRTDTGQLFENFFVSERLKFRSYNKIFAETYFWRDYNGSEIDLIEERNGQLFGFEAKWSKNKLSPINQKCH
jgi:predicted AAA+ superfamily ATPase